MLRLHERAPAALELGPAAARRLPPPRCARRRRSPTLLIASRSAGIPPMSNAGRRPRSPTSANASVASSADGSFAIDGCMASKLISLPVRSALRQQVLHRRRHAPARRLAPAALEKLGQPLLHPDRRAVVGQRARPRSGPARGSCCRATGSRRRARAAWSPSGAPTCTARSSRCAPPRPATATRPPPGRTGCGRTRRGSGMLLVEAQVCVQRRVGRLQRLAARTAPAPRPRPGSGSGSASSAPRGGPSPRRAPRWPAPAAP